MSRSLCIPHNPQVFAQFFSMFSGSNLQNALSVSKRREHSSGFSSSQYDVSTEMNVQNLS